MKKRMNGFQNKIFGIIMLVVSMTVLVLTIIFSGYVRRLSIEMMVERYENKTQRFLDSFMNYYDEIDSEIDNFIVNEYVQKSLRNAPLDAMDREMVTKALYLLGDQADYYLYIDNKGSLYSQKAITGGNVPDKETLVELLGSDYSKTKLVWMEDDYFGEGEKKLFACRFIRAMNQSHEPGILLLRLKLDYLNGEMGETKAEDAGCYILDSQNRICLSFGAEEKEETKESLVKQASRLITAGEKSQVTRKAGLVEVLGDGRNDFKVVTHVPYRFLVSTYYHVLMIVCLLFVVIIVIVFAVSLRVSKWLARPIEKINGFMNGFRDRGMKERLELHTDTELDTIGSSCNQMLDEIDELVEEVKYRESELRKSELQSLIYQINPHFLYNTLDAVYMLARLNHEKEIMQMIQALTKLLRMNLSNGAKMIPLRDELTYVKAYMDILKIRNDDLFDYEIICEESLKDRMIMKLLLQPLAENSVKHGFSRITEGGRIVILVQQVQKRLEIQVKNNGDLISEESMEKINRLAHAPMAELEHFLPQGKGGYGVSNVIKRLRLHYGGNVEFQFEIQEDYTVCRISILTEALER